MGAWVHVEVVVSSMSGLTYCGESRCICQTPQPDPASPCGYVYVEDDGGARCAWEPQEHAGSGLADHDHQPTTCLSCHHGIRRAEGGA